MAQAISHYTAVVTGGATLYRYVRPDDTSTATRIYAGTSVRLPADYGSRITNGMYPLQSPSGWMFWYHLTGVAAVYTTVTDACTPPDGLTIANGVLSISGGAGGDLNAWTGFGVSWRERRVSESAWGEWSPDQVITSRTVDVQATGGMVRQYRVRTMGEAGSDWYSPYAVCDTLLNGNRAAGVPVVLRPFSGTVTGVTQPVIRVECPPEPDGDAMTLQRSLNGGEWTDAASLTGEGGTVYDALLVGSGTHTVRYRLVDANGETGGEDGVAFTCEPRVWRRSLATGVVIASPEVSFVSDIQELASRIGEVCDFYGLNPLVLPGVPGHAEDWKEQLVAMRDAINRCREAVGLSMEAYATTSAWPRAKEINDLRSVIDRT